jgi:paired amphipathic helix protein Sin3a|eukprot:scaffold1131_cov278-Chaetoceros_neogracile.AAC.4
MTSSQQTSDFEDAIKYVIKVKREFADRPHIYNNFLEILEFFDSQDKFDANDFILRAADVFQGKNKTLILGLNPFLPDGYKIEIHGSGALYYSMPSCHHLTPIYRMKVETAPAA